MDPGGDRHPALSISIPIARITLSGTLVVPAGARGLVHLACLDAHGGAHPDTLRVAEVLNAAGLGTLVLGLLAEGEDPIYARRFDVPVLTQRLLAVHAHIEPILAGGLSLGCISESAGTAAALLAAARRPDRLAAIVSCGGRPDLAAHALAEVDAPTLLVVGAEDRILLELNRSALPWIGAARKELAVLPAVEGRGADAFEVEAFAELARDWLVARLARP